MFGLPLGLLSIWFGCVWFPTLTYLNKTSFLTSKMNIFPIGLKSQMLLQIYKIKFTQKLILETSIQT